VVAKLQIIHMTLYWIKFSRLHKSTILEVLAEQIEYKRKHYTQKHFPFTPDKKNIDGFAFLCVGGSLYIIMWE